MPAGVPGGGRTGAHAGLLCGLTFVPVRVLLSWEKLCVLRARLIVGDRKKYAPTVRTSGFRTVLLSTVVARADYSNGCLKNASGGEEG